MLDLLIAILISLGCNITADTSQEAIQSRYSTEYLKAKEIYETGSYKSTDGGGVVIDVNAGD